MQTFLNIPYTGTDDGMRYIDLFVPEENPTGLGVLFIHGGGWSAGNKEQFHSLATHFCQLGYTCASMSYRLSGQFKYPAQLEDARLGMAFLQRNAEQYLIDAQRIVSFGSSAGGHLALMLAFADEDNGGNSQAIATGSFVGKTRPCAVVAYCPVTDLKREKASYEKLMGNAYTSIPHLYKAASPIDQALSDQIPILVVTGDADTTTPLETSEAFCQKVTQAGGSAKLVVLPGVKHGFGYGVSTEAQKESIAHVEQFLTQLTAL